MKDLKKQYKDTFNNIKLDDKKINDNLYKIIRKDKKKKISKSLSFALVNSFVAILIVVISTISVTAHIDDIEKYFVNKDSEKIEVTIHKHDKTFDDNVFEDREKINLNIFQEKTNIKLLKPRDSNITLTLWTGKNNNSLSDLTAWYEFDNSGWYFTDKYNIFAFRAFVSFVDDYKSESDCGENNCLKNTQKLLLNNEVEILVFFRGGYSCNATFMYENVYYTFNYSEYKLSEKIKNKETRKQVYDNILEFVGNLIE